MRAWQSLERELGITAVHTGSHVRLRVDLRHVSFDNGAEWTVRVELTLDAGQAASGVRAEVAGRHGSFER
ncbi:DUF6228 family protein [Amycolatopsis sp. NPDC051903]|uniref:DUF6228 family protein n=1 Tax=Amycolatopsis sp. NPDC051903 TaxID=3363936 RepID=UPI003792C52D